MNGADAHVIQLFSKYKSVRTELTHTFDTETERQTTRIFEEIMSGGSADPTKSTDSTDKSEEEKKRILVSQMMTMELIC